MRLLRFDNSGKLRSTNFSGKLVPPYAILSHRWGLDEVLFEDLVNDTCKSKAGYQKILFCNKEAAQDRLQYFWIDTCCIDKWNLRELSKAINSMFRWYQNAAKCYVYLSDVSVSTATDALKQSLWEASFRASLWFTRGWTLQELIAPVSAEFFSSEGLRLGDKSSLEQVIHEITGIPIKALQNDPLAKFTITERMAWVETRETTEKEDIVYCLLGILNVFMPLSYGEGAEKALSRLHNELKMIKNVPFIVPFSQNDRFVGQEPQLAELEEKIFSNKQTTKIVITGQGGIGKSQLALEFAYRTRDKYNNCSVFWIPASDMDSLHQAYAHIAQKLDIPGWDDENTDVKDLVQHHLRRCTGQWLLIYDNADDPSLGVTGLSTTRAASLIDYLPQSESGCIITTTTNSDTAKALASQNIIELLEMTEHAAQRMLENHLNSPALISEQKERDMLLKELSYLPLAIVQAAAYVNVQKKTIKEYLTLLAEENIKESIELYAGESVDVLRRGITKNPVATTWLISMEEIRRDDPLAANHLLFMACIDRRDIPQDLLPLSTRPTKDVVRILSDYALVTERPAESALDLHRLLHIAIRKWLQKQEWLDQWAQKAIARLLKVFPDQIHGGRSKWRRLFPHAKHVLSLPLQKNMLGEAAEERHELAFKVGQCLQEEGRIRDAVIWFEELFQWNKENLAEEHPRRLNSQVVLASAYLADGQVKKAVELLEHVVAARSRTLAEDHSNRLNSQYEVAITYLADGQVKKAVEILEYVVAIWLTALGEDHPDVLNSQHELALTYIGDGQIQKAIDLLEHVVAVRSKVLVEDHPDRLVSQHELARAYLANGQVKKAVELIEHVVAVRSTSLAEDHVGRLNSQHILAFAYLADGQIKKAIDLLGHMISKRLTVQSEDQPDVLNSQHLLAFACLGDGQVKKAVELLEHVVAVRSTLLAEDHPDRLISQQELGRAYLADGQVKKSAELLEHVVVMRSKFQAEEHLDRLGSQRELGRAYLADGQVKKAVELLEHVVALRSKLLAEEHPNRLGAQYDLARAYLVDGQVDKGVELLEYVVALRSTLLAEDHPDRLMSQRELVHVHQANGKPGKAVELLRL